MPGKRNNLSIAKKNELIKAYENSNLSKAAFAKANAIARTTLNNILASKSSLSGVAEKRKRQRASPYENVEKALLTWVKCARSQNAPISWMILKQKSMEIASELGEKNFTASNGFLQRFNSRHKLTFKRICGEAANCDIEGLKEWKESVLTDILERYTPSDVYNLDECGLFYRVMPNKTLSFKDEKCVGGKKSKERLTVLLGSNMDGSEKLTPLVIGKFLKPRCLKNCKSLPVIYEANKKAWMTTDIWMKIIYRLDAKFAKQNRHVAIIADNCSAHCAIDGLTSIELIFLPPNSTSVSQPMDQGIIQNFKVHYRNLLLKDMISSIDKKENFFVSVFHAICYIDKGWNMVSKKTIENCFKHAGFIKQEIGNETQAEQEESSDDEDMPLAELCQMLRNRGCEVDEATYARIDTDVATACEVSVSDIISQVLNLNPEGSDEEDDTAEIKLVTKAEALKALDSLRSFFANSHAEENHFKAVRDLETAVLNSSDKNNYQSCITDYFK